jgi:hypothetical protein
MYRYEVMYVENDVSSVQMRTVNLIAKLHGAEEEDCGKKLG